MRIKPPSTPRRKRSKPRPRASILRSPHATASAKTLEERLKVLDEQIEKMLADADQVDQQDKDLFGDNVSTNTLPMELADLKKRQTELGKALEAAKKADAKPAHLAETQNGFIKQVIGLRQFLLRGLDKVRTEWLRACTAFNIRKLILATRMLRAEGTVTLV